MFRQEGSRVSDHSVYVGAEEVWTRGQAVARQRSLSEFSLLKSCALVLYH